MTIKKSCLSTKRLSWTRWNLLTTQPSFDSLRQNGAGGDGTLPESARSSV